MTKHSWKHGFKAKLLLPRPELDAEGEIIATNLRGDALENKLSSIFEK